MRFAFILFFGIFLWAYWVINSHPQGAIVSWDEGFHGGSALFISQSLRDNFSFGDYTYILNDFKNGMIWYPPLWLFLAGPMGAVFGPSVEIYRTATLIFSILSIILIIYFVKSISNFKAAIIAGLTLAFTPIFIVYSHLMMREIPNLFGITLPLLLFYKYLTITKPNPKLLLFTAFAFALGVLAKVVSIVIIFVTVFCFGVILYLFYRKDYLWRRFCSRWTFYFLIIGFLTFNLFRIFTQKILNADLLFFHLEQTKQLSGSQVNILIVAIKTFFENIPFYFRDFSHMPALTVFWFGSFLSYIIVRRSILSIFLMVWLVVIYIAFSAVKPQAPQYLLPIFAPLSIGVGLFWNEVLASLRRYTSVAFVVLIIGIVWLELIHLDRTETIGWRTLITNQDRAATFVVDNAQLGDRVISSGDGTRFLIRLLGLKKKLQTINGAAPVCPESIQDSTEWAILEYGPQNPVRLKGIIDNDSWVKQTSFKNSIEPISVFKNTKDTKRVIISLKNIVTDRCIRLLLPGVNKITVVATTYVKEDIHLPNSNLIVALKVNPLKTIKELSLNQDELIKNGGSEQIYNIWVNQQKINQPTYLFFTIPSNITIDIKKVEILKERD